MSTPNAEYERGNGVMSGFVCNAPATDVADKPVGWNSDKWATPWPIVRQLEERYGVFDLDPCCEPHTAKAPTFYTAEDDGLAQPWFGNVFVNPPFSNPRAWCRRAIEAVRTGEADQVVMLLPAAVDTAWFHEIVWPNAELHFLRGRVRFLGWRGTPLPSPRAPSMVAVFSGRIVGHDCTATSLDVDGGLIDVDSCVAPLVETLNDAGCRTVASCCGHGRRPGNIALADGRELIIASTYDEARRIENLFPLNINGEVRVEVGTAHNDGSGAAK